MAGRAGAAGNRTDRFQQMSEQERLIEEKKRQILNRLQNTRRSQAVSQNEESKTEKQDKKPNDDLPSAELKPKPNIFTNDGSFLDQFQKFAGQNKKEIESIQMSRDRSRSPHRHGTLLQTQAQPQIQPYNHVPSHTQIQPTSLMQPQNQMLPNNQMQPRKLWGDYAPVPPPPLCPQNIPAPSPLIPQTIPPPRPMDVPSIPPPDPLAVHRIPPPPQPPSGFPPPHFFQAVPPPLPPPIPTYLPPQPVPVPAPVPADICRSIPGPFISSIKEEPKDDSYTKQRMKQEEQTDPTISCPKDDYEADVKVEVKQEIEDEVKSEVEEGKYEVQAEVKHEIKVQFKHESEEEQACSSSSIKTELSEKSRIEEERKAGERERKRRSRWGEKSQDIPPPVVATTVPKINVTGMSGHLLSKVTRTEPGLLQYAMQAYGSTNLSEEDWKKAEDNYKVHLLYQDMLTKRAEVQKLHNKGKHKYEYDSDEETEGGTWEHKVREKEMVATQHWADSLTEMAKGKHHIGDFLPPDELKRFMDKYSALKGGSKEPDLSDYKEYKLTEENKGFQMLQKLGWTEGKGLGSDGGGIVEPINKAKIRDTNQGLGVMNPGDVDGDDDEYAAYRKRMMLAYRFRPNPLNNPRRPYY